MAEKRIPARNKDEVLKTLGVIIQDIMETPTLSKEEYAFYLGHMNIIASVLAIDGTKDKNGKMKCNISLDYDKVLNIYKEVQEEEEKDEKQYTFEELFPNLFKEIDERIAKSKKENKEE